MYEKMVYFSFLDTLVVLNSIPCNESRKSDN